MAKLKEKEEAILLRKKGISFAKIAKELGVAKSSVSKWVRHVKLPEKIRKDLYDKQRKGREKGIITLVKNAKDLRLKNQDKGREFAKKGNLQHAMGCMIYWGEGRKGRNTVAIANTDSDLLLFFKAFIDTFFNVKKEEFRITVNCYLNNGFSKCDIEKYWLKLLSLPDCCFKKSIFKTADKLNSKSHKIHPYGVCTLQLNRTDIVQQIFGSIQEYLKINKPEWLNDK